MFSVPWPWPPAERREILSETSGGTSITLLANEQGQLVATAERGPERTRFASPSLVFSKPGVTVVTVRWTPTSLEVLFGDTVLPCDAGDGTKLALELGGMPRTPHGRVFLTLDPATATDEDDRFFLETLDDVDAKLLDGKRYSIIRAAGLLRQLLLDGLLDRANARHRLKFKFEVLDSSSPVPGSPSLEWTNLDPADHPRAPTDSLSRDQLLATPFLRTPSGSATVHDLIRACANVKGGVHLGKTRTSAQKMIVDWDEAIRVCGQEMSIATMSGLVRVVLKGLVPLVLKIDREAPPTGMHGLTRGPS